MLNIFEDERRGSRAKAPDPFGTGPFSIGAASQMSCVGPATRRLSLLTPIENGSRHDDNLIPHRP